MDAGGGCVPIYQYEAMLRTPGYNESALAYYPSNNYTYCATIDATCASCRATWMESSSVAKGAASSCTGAGGCVCVAYCEMPEWSKIVLERNLCPSFVSTITTSKEVAYYKLLIALGIGIGLCAVFTVIALGVRYLVRILEARSTRCDPLYCRVCIRIVSHKCCLTFQFYNVAELARLNRRRRPRREPSGPQLRLSGWKAMLDDLIESERVQLGGDARAPVLTAEAPTVLVEEGDGYRPMSPSTPHDRE